jgi:nucleoid DNA-binding protein
MGLNLRVKDTGCPGTRKGRNPITGEDLTLDPRRVITFKCSPRMRKRINGKG